jgi:threonylcarbamoyladenosine tRNA methylthiotransferase MtaB
MQPSAESGSRRPRVALTTLGCKVNRADTDELCAEIAPCAELVAFGEEVELSIVFSCAVTATAERQSRQLLFRARRANPRGVVLLAGCLAETLSPEAARSLSRAGVRLAGRSALLPLVRELLGGAASPPGLRSSSTPRPDDPRERSLLKVQDGCDAACTYCIVPRARGKSRSAPVEEVLAKLEVLARRGSPEVVLTGIHLGLYGMDLRPSTTLSALVSACLGAGPRIRLSSLEPLEIDARIRELLFDARSGLCPHLHIPIQSGDDGVLAAMGRPYRALEVEELLHDLRRGRADLALGADLIVGFPGEEDAAFERTLALVERSPLTHLHVFPFSVREGTAAASLGRQVPGSVAKERAAVLRALGRRKLRAFAAAQLGTSREIVVETLSRTGGRAHGTTDNYLKVNLSAAPPVGQRALVRLDAFADSEQVRLLALLGS